MDARPCVERVRFSRCPASALICIGPGPLGDAPGNFPLVVAFVDVSFVSVAGFVWMPLCRVFVKLITDGVRTNYVCSSCGVRGVCTVERMKNAHNAFINAPFVGEGRAFSQGWGSLTTISSLPLVPCGPADRKGAGTRSVSGVRRRSTSLLSLTLFLFLSIYISTIYLIILICRFVYIYTRNLTP